MTEDQIEMKVERAMNQLDRVFMSSKMPQADYDARVDEINAWAERQYRAMPQIIHYA